MSIKKTGKGKKSIDTRGGRVNIEMKSQANFNLTKKKRQTGR
jgi:hypothetical protein